MRVVLPAITFENGAAIALVNGEWVPYFAGGQGAFGYNQSSGSSQQYSGLRGTPYFGDFAQRYVDVNKGMTHDVMGYANSDPNTFRGQTGAQIAGTNPQTGLPMALNTNLNTVAEGMYSKASAGGAMRGQVSPESTTGVVGSSLQNIGQFLTPYVLDWSKYTTGLPEELKKSRLGMYQNTMAAMAPAVGSQGQSGYSGFGFNVSGGMGTVAT